ncbi:mitochondrial genome maintenance exonuclease 1 [Ambystoma mexicanum]|uniref:mitochondrial genome maintenance exonuclease 1 n=1 Tax=Ambystoma mexicanum TaxID=8296 RepID=UPI0037E96088
MKSLQPLTRHFGRLQVLLTQCLHKEKLPCMPLHTSCHLDGKKKKVNGYEAVEPEKYADLFRSVTTSKVRSRTPEALCEEDTFLFGKVIKSHPPVADTELRTPQNWIPLANPDKRIMCTEKTDPRIPLKISLPSTGPVPVKIPSVTRVLQKTMPMEQAFYLERWKQKMIMELGEEGFIEYTAAVFSKGRLFHTSLEALLLSSEEQIQERDRIEVSDYLSSVEHILGDIRGVRALESAVHHHTLQYRGLVDCVAEYRGQLCVIDWKTSEKPKPHLRDTFDNPLQVAAYIGAINHDGNYNFQVSCGLIVVAYKDGSPAHPHFMDSELCSQYWNKWLLRLEEFLEKKEKNPVSV